MIRIKKRSFTLLEVMIALGLFLLASGAIGWKAHKAIEKKRFETDLGRLESQILVCQRLALATQSDWKGVLTKQKEGWIFEALCTEDPNTKKLKVLRLHPFGLFLNGSRTDGVEFNFFSTGKTLPEGTLLFVQNAGDPPLKKEWVFPNLFQSETSGKPKKGPIHPEEGEKF